jgi:hypothetical protein
MSSKPSLLKEGFFVSKSFVSERTREADYFMVEKYEKRY